MKTEIFNYFDELINSNVTYSRAGGGAGSVLLIQFDKEGSAYSLFIACTWRIENGDKVITTSADNTTANTGPMAKGVRLLEGQKVLSVQMNKFYDLTLKFENDLRLKLFCDLTPTNVYSSDANWDFSVIHEDKVFEVTSNFEIKKGKYYSNNDD